MNKLFKKSLLKFLLSNAKWKLLWTGFLFLLIINHPLTSYAQGEYAVKGTVVDDQQEPLAGVTVVLKGKASTGTSTDVNGAFSLTVPGGKQTLVVSYIGMQSQEVNVDSQSRNIRIILLETSLALEEVVIVGYGQQKKASVVGAITQTSGKVLERAGGVSSLGMALTGNLPGVITYSSSGMPGAEDPMIIIRTMSSWNNSAPLVLVDGIERPMNTIDIASVETISVLKDASATAVYGVKGANGVILITTKRGQEGKANIQARANMTAKTVSQLPEKLDSYDSYLLRNTAIERELPLSPGGWSAYKPMDIISKYRNPLNDEEWDRYPNVDWEKELFKDMAMSYNASVNVAGGTKLVNYFAAIDFLHEGDLFKTFQNGRGYNSGYGYNRINVRSNLDFNLTKTTKFSTNLFGSNGVRTLPWGASDSDASYWASAYRTAPDAMRPVYSNGMWGWYAPRNADVPNSVYSLAMSGIEKRTTTQINIDFIINQELDMITKGLSFKADLSVDNTFKEEDRGINDLYNAAQRMWVNPESGIISYEQVMDAGTQLDYSESIRWINQSGSVDMDATYRKQYYSLQLNYARQFGKHDVTAMGLFSREKYATGSEFSHFREDWVFRTTYNYAMKYIAEINGAYNGSEKFGPTHRFAFFPSYSGGWMISEEKFMKPVKFLDMMKFRASWGRIGDDNAGGRWLYADQWSYGGNTLMGSIPANTPYNYYRISSLGNENISWETVEKRNFGVDYSFLQGLVAGSVDIFNDERSNIFISGDSRSIPSFFGATAPAANLGVVRSNGYELELRLNYTFSNKLRVWANTSMTHAQNEVIFRDDPELYPLYQKAQGFPIGQTKSYINNGFITSWDDLYGSSERSANNANKLPGDYNIVDFNGDGIIDSYDQAPYQYTGVPQNTYNASLGLEWKNFSCFVQFYGVNNVSRYIDFPTFHSTSNVAYVEGTYWTKDGGGDIPLPRWTTLPGEGNNGTRYLYDGSYLRLKNAEIAYTFNNKWINKLGIKSCKLYLNGDNLLLWTKMPDDRESNFSGSASFGAYPTVRRFNLGIDITF
ncbi:MAG: TonB-dependent receptor [Tannerella sp.]|jgi:TonB-linked SusC/RagA family outer membrane protein|nr:TonB-dependent receptor [Tannerella sp.]